jgi:RNA polymerase sigma-70 factor (ECF subfamily)
MTSEATAESADVMQPESQRETFLRLIDEYDLPLRRLAAAYLQKPADREDLVQEIALALWQAVPNFRGQASERTWLYRIAHNVAISSSAKIRRTWNRESQVTELFDPPSASANAAAVVLADERHQLLIDCIRGLSQVDRQIILLHLESLSYSEIKEVTGLSETAIAARLTRIRGKLKEEINNREAGTI